jgi:hypothetical protein
MCSACFPASGFPLRADGNQQGSFATIALPTQHAQNTQLQATPKYAADVALLLLHAANTPMRSTDVGKGTNNTNARTRREPTT